MYRGTPMAGKPSYKELEQRIVLLEAARDARPMMDRAVEKLFDLSPDMLCVADFDGYFRLVNSAFERQLGYSKEALLKKRFIEFVHPEDRAATLAAMRQLADGGAVRNFENRYRCADGSFKWLAWNSVPVIEERFCYAVARDITEQKAVQRELASQRDLFDNVLSNVPASIFWKDRNSVFLGVNQRFVDDAGLQHPQQVIGKTDYDLAWSKEEADFYRECDRQVMDRGEPMLNIVESQQRPDGKQAELLTHKVPLHDASGQVTGMLGIYMDITKLKETESTLSRSQARLQTLFDSAAEFIFVIDPQGDILKANRYVYEHSGYGADEVIGANIKEFFTEESKQICDCNFPALRERGYNRADIELVCKDGRIIQMECSATAVPDEQGNFTTFLIIQRDVTERNSAAAALANSERRFRALFNSTFQFSGLLDPDGIVLEANQTVLDFLGCKKDDLVGQPFWEIMWKDVPADEQESIKSAVQNARQGRLVRYQAEMVGKDNVTRTVDISLKPVLNEMGETMLIIPEGRDITELRQAEEKLRRHQQEMAHVMRLSTMGEMASGMAHELNQPLTALLSYCGSALTLAKSLPSPSQQLSDILERATEQADRAGQIIRHLREFVGKEADEMKPVNIDETIDDLETLLYSELKSTGVKLEHHLDSQGRNIKANKVQIEQVLVNLIRNSVEAIQSIRKNDGKVTLTTRLSEDDFVEVTVADNGPGVEASMNGKMFNPFQTSKASGMGMGLSISRTIIQAHGGELWADKDHPNGALFGFRLPVSD
jgi:PAS domain S-box-containing protein